MEFLNRLSKEYDINEIVEYEKLTKGQSASTYLLRTAEDEKYILKTIETIEKALFENEILSHLGNRNHSIVGGILHTKSHKPYFQNDQLIFQLQLYIPSVNDVPPLIEVLKSYKLLAEGMKSFQSASNGTNRFSLELLWRTNHPQLMETYAEIYNAFYMEVSDLIKLDKTEECWIHGDLGKWNLLMNDEQQVCFIDFSEARRGPEYFDLVALFTSFVPKNSDEIARYVEVFLEIYELHIDTQKFMQTIKLWYIKGILSLVKLDSKSAESSILYLYQQSIHCNDAIRLALK